MGKFSGASSVQRAQEGQLLDLDLPTGPAVEAPAPAAEPAAPPPQGSLMDELRAAEPSPEAQADVETAVQEGIEPLAAEVERQSIPSLAERGAGGDRVDRWLRPPTPARSVSSQSPDGNLRSRAAAMAKAVETGAITPIISSRGTAGHAVKEAGGTGPEVAEAIATEKEGSLTAAIERAGAVVTSPTTGKPVPAPEYVQVASVVTENMIADLAYGEEVTGDPLGDAIGETITDKETGEVIPVTHAQGNARLGQQIHQEFQRMQGVKVPEKLPKQEAETVGGVFKDMWAANNPDLVTKAVDPKTNQLVYQLTAQGQTSMQQGAADRKRLFPKQHVRPAKTPLPTGQLPGDIGENVVKPVAGAVGKPKFGNIIKQAMTNLAQVPNVVDKQRAKLLFSTILPVLQSGDHSSWQAEINNFGPSKLQKFQAAAAQQTKRQQEAQSMGQDFDEDFYDPQANMDALTDKIAQEVQAIAKERNGANYLSYGVQAFNGRISPQQSFFDPTTSKAVRFVTRNAVPAIAKPGSRIEKNLRQMYAMMLVKGADAKLPNEREVALNGAAPKLEAWGDRLNAALEMSDADYDAISTAIEQGIALDDQAFPQVKPLNLDEEADAELIAAIESKGEDGPHFMDGLMDFANYTKAKRRGVPHNSYFNAYIDGKTNGLASNGIQMGHIGTAERTGVVRNNRKQLLDDGDIRDELKKIAIDSISDGWDGDTDGFESELNDVAEQVFGNRDLNKKTTMTFGYGKEIESFGKDIEETIALISEMKSGQLDPRNPPLSADPNAWTQEQKTEYLMWQRGKLKEESTYEGFNAEVLFHSSPQPNISTDGFQYRPVNVPNKGSSGKGPGIFTHGADTDASKYGNNVYAVIYNKKEHTYAGKEDTSANALDEIFVPQKGVEEITRIFPPSPDVIAKFIGETDANRASGPGDSFNTSLAAVDAKMSRAELAETLLTKYETSLREVLSDDALESRELMRSAAMLHAATNTLFSIKSYVGQDLNFGHDVSTGYDEAGKTTYRLYGEGVTGPDKRTVAHYESEATSSAARTRDGKATPGEYAYGGSVVGPVQSLDAATVALTAAGRSWDRLKQSSGGNPYMHTIYDAFKMDAMGYDVVMEEVNKNWLDASMKWSYLEETLTATDNALKGFNEDMKSRDQGAEVSENEAIYMNWLLTPEETLSGKLFMKNFARKIQKVKDFTKGEADFNKSYSNMIAQMRAVGYDVYNPPAKPTVTQLRTFVQVLAKELELKPRLSHAVSKTNKNKALLKSEILKKGYKTPSGERIALQYYAH